VFDSQSGDKLSCSKAAKLPDFELRESGALGYRASRAAHSPASNAGRRYLFSSSSPVCPSSLELCIVRAPALACLLVGILSKRRTNRQGGHKCSERQRRRRSEGGRRGGAGRGQQALSNPVAATGGSLDLASPLGARAARQRHGLRSPRGGVCDASSASSSSFASAEPM
jgi:hypothetical protein